jgi:hypothetical protein
VDNAVLECPARSVRTIAIQKQAADDPVSKHRREYLTLGGFAGDSGEAER